MSIQSIDINCDLGETYGKHHSHQDHLLMPYISSCNIACGFHSGDPLTIERTIRLAKQHHVSIGAHPSFPDLQGFGRRYMEMSPQEIKAVVMYQIAALKGMVEAQGMQLQHVKPHGALYNSCATNKTYASAILDAVEELDASLMVYGLADSLFGELALTRNISFCHEVFIDRAYEDDLQLRSRTYKDAVLNHHDAIHQLDLFIQEGAVKTVSGVIKPLSVDSICIHSDTPDAVDIAKSIHENLKISEVEIITNR